VLQRLHDMTIGWICVAKQIQQHSIVTSTVWSTQGKL
jgi:hypothetical protein